MQFPHFFCRYIFFFNFVLFHPVFVDWKVIFRVKLEKFFFPKKCVSTLWGGEGSGKCGKNPHFFGRLPWGIPLSFLPDAGRGSVNKFLLILSPKLSWQLSITQLWPLYNYHSPNVRLSFRQNPHTAKINHSTLSPTLSTSPP